MENLYTVGTIFLERLFRVPDYQRGYAWETQQCQDFIEDLELLEDGKQHFMGTLILQANVNGSAKIVDRGGRAYICHDVIDGQQRLTTIVLFLHTLHQELSQFEELQDLVADLKRNYVVTYDRDKLPIFKLTLNDDTHAFFRDAILSLGHTIQGPAIQSQRRLLDAQNYFRNYLAKKQAVLGDIYVTWLESLYFKIVQQLTLMVYTVQSEADAGIIFETMNNRGKPLTELEKVKNYLLYLAGRLHQPVAEQLSKQINGTWSYIYRSLMVVDLGSRGNEDQLLRAHWLMAYDYQSQNWDGSRSIKNHFDLRDYQGKYEELLTSLQEYLSSLKNATTAYCDLLRPEHSNAFDVFKLNKGWHDEIVAAGSRLVRVGSLATFLPLLIAVRIKEDGRAYLEALRLCERFAFRVYRWMGRRANTGESWLFRLGYNLYQGQQFDAVQNELRRAILNYCNDGQFQARFRRENENWYNWSGLKYFLYEYEYHLATQKGRAVKMPWEFVARKPETIEHILPQTPDGGGYWQARFTSENYTRYLHDIGNLTLTQDNSVLSNKPFNGQPGVSTKKEIFSKESSFWMERQLVESSDWTVEAIEARRQAIEKWAVQRWYVEPPPAETVKAESVAKKKQTVAKITELAIKNSVGDVFEAILNAVAQHGIRPRPWVWCVTLAPPQGRRYALAAIWPKPGRLSIGVWLTQFPQFFNVSYEDVEAILGADVWRNIDASNVDDFIEKLHHLFGYIEGEV